MLRGWVALTGTPGVGKSVVADALRLHGISNVNLGRFAQDYELVADYDEARMSAVVDPAKIAPALASLHQKGSLLLLDGHWSHEVPGVQDAIVLRLRPKNLRARLERRGWHESKVRENLEAEGIDLVLQEAIGRLSARRVHEIDTTDRDLETVAKEVYGVLRGTRPREKTRPGQVDWSSDVLAWY